jgi:hypothetical protein
VEPRRSPGAKGTNERSRARGSGEPSIDCSDPDWPRSGTTTDSPVLAGWYVVIWGRAAMGSPIPARNGMMAL